MIGARLLCRKLGQAIRDAAGLPDSTTMGVEAALTGTVVTAVLALSVPAAFLAPLIMSGGRAMNFAKRGSNRLKYRRRSLRPFLSRGSK